MQGDIQLSVENVEADYNHSIVALHGVSVTVRRGEIVALIGANGAGKTTTLNAVSNYIRTPTRPEFIAHRDFTPIQTVDDDALLRLARAQRQAAE